MSAEGSFADVEITLVNEIEDGIYANSKSW